MGNFRLYDKTEKKADTSLFSRIGKGNQKATLAARYEFGGIGR